MLGWLYRVFVGRFHVPVCDHVWATQKTVELHLKGDAPSAAVVGWEKHLCCTKCGDWKAVRL